MEDRARIDDLITAGVPDVTAGYGARVFAMGRLFRDLLAAYPRIRRHVHVYHPDYQSPIDTAELVWGSDLLLALSLLGFNRPAALDALAAGRDLRHRVLTSPA